MSSSSGRIRRARPLLGTLVEITASGPAGAPLAGAVDAAFAVIMRVQALMSFHDLDSDLSRLNREAAARSIPIDPWTRTVLEAALHLWRLSGGLFDCTVAPALVAMGFLPEPSLADRRVGTMGDVELSPAGVRFRQPLALDLGGIAKGFAVDRAADYLALAGLSGVVNAGGDLRIFGDAFEAVHVRDPEQPGMFRYAGRYGNVALASSAGYNAARRVAGRWVQPIVDRSTDRALGGRAAVTVVAPTCMMADALTKPVLLSPATAGPLLAAYGARALFLAGE